MLFGLFNKKDNGGPETYIHAIALPLITAGLLIVAAPDFRDLLLHYLDKRLHTNLDFAQKPLAGWVLLALGILIYASERWIGHAPSGTLLALRHQSFLPLPRTLSIKDLPAKISPMHVQPIDCDLHALMSSDPPNILAALRVQGDWMSKVVGTISSLPDAQIAYYGVVHIPFQFLAGFRFSTYKRVRFFELVRGQDKWLELNALIPPKPIAIMVDSQPSPSGVTEDVSLRISISYTIQITDVEKSISLPYTDIHLRLAVPKIDSIRSCSDVQVICSAFRTILDDDSVRGKRIHLFYSGPVSLGFALGQQISSSIHGEIHVYNYDVNSQPPYAWSVQLRQNPEETHVRRY